MAVFTVASLGEEVEMLDTMGVAATTETQASDDACVTTDTTGSDVLTAGSWVAVECCMKSSAKVEVLACHGLKTLSLEGAEGSKLTEAATEDSAGEVNPELHVMASSTGESGE